MKTIMLTMISCICLFVYNIASADEFQILTVEEPPSSFMNVEDEPSGFSVDIVREIQHRINNNDPIKVVPELRALKTASEVPNVVLFSFSRTPERENNFHWIMLLMRKPWVMYSKKGAGFILTSLEDSRKMRSIGVVRGDVRALYLQQMGFSNLEVVAQHEQNVKKLMSGRIQMLFYEPPGMSFICRKLGLPMSAFEPVLKTAISELYIMMSKKGTDPKAVNKWQSAARGIKEDGTFQRIAEKWANKIYEQYGIDCVVKDGALTF